MPAVLNYSTHYTAKPKLVRVRQSSSLDHLLRRAVASIDKGEVKLIPGCFRLLKRERPLTRFEQAVLLIFASCLGLAIWMQARPEPISAHTGYYQSLALSIRADSTSARAFTESALVSIGSDWRPSALFARAHPLFWMRTPAIHPNKLANRLEEGLGRLAGHGQVVSATAFDLPDMVATEKPDGAVTMTCRLTGQVELADGSVFRFWARLIQDNKSKQWGILDLSIPPFLS